MYLNQSISVISVYLKWTSFAELSRTHNTSWLTPHSRDGSVTEKVRKAPLQDTAIHFSLRATVNRSIPGCCSLSTSCLHYKTEYKDRLNCSINAALMLQDLVCNLDHLYTFLSCMHRYSQVCMHLLMANVQCLRANDEIHHSPLHR